MADETSGPIVEAAEAAQLAADAQAEAAEEIVELATARAEAAEETAAAITQAALQTEQGRRIETLGRELEQCRQEYVNLQSDLNQLKTLMATMSANQSPPTIVETAPTPQSGPIPPAASPPKTEIVMAENPENAEGGDLPVREIKRRRHVL